MLNKVFGKWTVINVASLERKSKSNRSMYYICRCECGTIKPVRSDGLRSGKSTQCLPCKKQVIDTKPYIGNKFGKWLVLEVANDGSGTSSLLCQCQCGNQVIIRATHLRNGRNQCYECFKIQRISNLTTHGLTHKKEYQVWLTMKMRCHNPKRPQYKWYGSRGIKVCDRWLNSFENFYKDMGDRPHGYQIDRINNDGDYSPNNCRWVTPKENNDNRRCSLKNKISKDQLTIAYPD